MKKSIKLISVFTLLLLSFCPTDSLAISCRGPNGSFSVGCNESRSPTEICESAGYKFSAVLGSTVYCMDKNCAVGNGPTCARCNPGYLLNVSNYYQCSPCPSGATCDGTNRIVSCPDGSFVSGNTCAPCSSGCATCVDSSTRCTSCKPGYFLYNGSSCQPCPAYATCAGGTSFPVCRDGYSHMTPTNPNCRLCKAPCKSCTNGNPDYCTACYSGFKAVNGQCVEDEPEPTKKNTVNTCPSRMTLSADGCCCVNK